jgi:hypothetical protein
MNLFYDPSLIALSQLIDNADKSLPAHNIVVDYDGEVIIDPEKKFAGVNISRFKFCTQINDAVNSDTTSLMDLFDTLRTAYNGTSQYIQMNGKLKNVA